MSEFYFDYKCIAMGEQNALNPKKALAFYLYQDYGDTDNSMCVQIYIPKEMQNKYCGAKVFFSPNDVKFPDITATKTTSTTKITLWQTKYKENSDREGNFICKDNCIYIKSKELSGCGVIAFLEGDDINAIPEEKNTYKFIINFSKKEAISYRIIERRKSIKIEVLYPLLREDIKLKIAKKRGAKPILVKDFLPEETENLKYDNKEVIVLKANGHVKDFAKKTLRIDDPKQYDFRLTFLDPKHAAYYLLVDESDYTYEDRKQRKKDIASKRKMSIYQNRCPYCGKPLMSLQKKYNKGTTAIVGCNGEEIITSIYNEKLLGKITRVCSSDLVTLSKLSSSKESFISYNNLIIPEKYEEAPAMNVVVAGFPGSGKTIFLSSVFNMQHSGDGQEIKSYPVVLNKIVETFDRNKKKNHSVEEIKFLNINTENGCSIDDFVERIRQSNDSKIKTRYLLTTGKHVESYTEANDVWKLSWHPIGFKMGNLGHIYFYDIPGEMFKSTNSVKIRSLDMADCLLAVINGAPNIEDPIGQLLSTLEKIPSLSENRLDMEHMPIAVVFTKHDLKLATYLGKEKNKENCFEDNCHVVRENIIDMLAENKNGKYEGSLLERHIDCSSYELEHYLKSRDKSGKYKRLKENYKNIKFFTCSALGSDLCLGNPNEETKEVLFKPRRLRIELPIIWLMYKKGLIKG